MNITTTTQQQPIEEENVKTSFGHRFGNDAPTENVPFSGQQQNTKKGEEKKRERLKIMVSEYEKFSDSVGVMIITKNKLCEIFSQYMNILFTDYLGCNYVFNQTGAYELVGYFSADRKNSGAKTTAFDVITKAVPTPQKKGMISNIVGNYAIFDIRDQIYKVTRDGVDLLSDIVMIQNPQDVLSDGLIKNFQYGRYYRQIQDFQNINVNQQQYNLQYQGATAPIYAVVIMDPKKLLMAIYGNVDDNTGSPVDYTMSFATSDISMKSFMGNSNPLFIILRTNNNELQQASIDVGIIPNVGVMEIH